MKYHHIPSAILLSCLMTGTALANQQLFASMTEWPWVAAVSAGSAWQSGGDSQTFYLTPGIEKTYHVNNPDNALATGEVFVGLQTHLPHSFLGQLGIAASTSDNATEEGIIWDDASPVFDNYSYRYKVSHSFLGMKGIFLMDGNYGVMPWISVSAGVGFNDAYGYSNTPLIPEAVMNTNFSSQSNRAFSYTLGIGVQKALNQHLQLGIGYQFADWGKSQLGNASGQTVGSGLVQNHLYTNGVLINATYVA